MKIAAAKDMKLVKENMISYVDDHGDLREATEHVYKIEVALTMRDFNVDEDADFLDEVARKLVRAYATKTGTNYSWSLTPRGVAYDLGLLED